MMRSEVLEGNEWERTDHSAMTSTVIAASQNFKSVLACCVPDRHLDGLILYAERLDSELCSGRSKER